jgi:MFS transporter, DHA1 family, tetracycline resistance protein
MKRSNTLLLFIVILDAMGIGIVFPVLPLLLRSLLHGSGDVARHFGYLLAAYAATMLFASPVLGVLSDRYGRRPLLLFSLAGTAFDDLIMAIAPTLSILYIGRTLAGITGANLTVANAYMADTTSEENRAAAFGRMNACFGIGFIAGPILGGLAGAYSLRAPFYLAAALNCVGFLICSLALPESRKPSTHRAPITLAQLNPFASLRAVSQVHGAARLLYIFCTMDMIGQVPGVLWVIYGTANFHWTSVTVGLSLALFGLLHAACQALLPALSERRLGRRGTVAAGMAADSSGFILFSIARSTFGAFCAIPFLCLGGIGLPALQSMLSATASEDRQGELQGVLTSFNSLVAIVGPLLAANFYEALQRQLPSYPGSIFLFTTLLYLPCFYLLIRQKTVPSVPDNAQEGVETV